jgi:hypothetical protein
MDRTKFFNEVTVDGIKELDFLDNTLINFDVRRPTLYYRVKDVDLRAPDLISYKAYGQEQYWWVICLVNNILDVSTDLTLGKVLVIPNILDVYDFAKRWRKR